MMDASGILATIVDAASKTTFVEWGAFITAMLYVYLASKERVWCWIFGIISSALTAYVFFNAKLYYESLLNIFYVFVGFYGWYEWARSGKREEKRPIISYSYNGLVTLLIIGAICAGILGYISLVYTQSPRPYIDAAIASFSILATWMTARKIIENWILWIVLDAVAVFLYADTGLYLFVLLYLMYTMLAVYGFFQWKKRLAREPTKHS